MDLEWSIWWFERNVHQSHYCSRCGRIWEPAVSAYFHRFSYGKPMTWMQARMPLNPLINISLLTLNYVFSTWIYWQFAFQHTRNPMIQIRHHSDYFNGTQNAIDIHAVCETSSGDMWVIKTANEVNASNGITENRIISWHCTDHTYIWRNYPNNPRQRQSTT